MEKNIEDTKHLFKVLKIKANILSTSQRRKLNNEGYLVILPTKKIKKKLKTLSKVSEKLIKLEGDKGGWEAKEKFYKKGKLFEYGTNRLGNLINKHKIFKDLILVPELLAAAHEVTKCDIKIAGFNLRNPRKGSGKQKIHMDWKPRKNKKEPYGGIVCFFFIDEANVRNGSLRIVPRSHKKFGWPEKHVNVFKNHKKEIRMNVKAGTMVIANLNLWHGGSENISGKPRKMIMINIKRRNLPQLINYKKYLSTNTKKSLNNSQKYLLAVRKNDKLQKANSVGVGKYYKGDFYLKKK